MLYVMQGTTAPPIRGWVNEGRTAILLTGLFKTAAVTAIQADGDELNFILGNTVNLPTVRRNVVTWIGETAQFIAENLLQSANAEPSIVDSPLHGGK